MTAFTILVAIPIFFFLVLVKMYNSLVYRKNQLTNIFSSLEVLLNKRYKLIPKLVSSVSKYMVHEQDTFQTITELRLLANRPSTTEEQKMEIDNEITAALGKIMLAVENYPDLKARKSVLHLQGILIKVEAQISAARSAYNQAVTNYNDEIEIVPANIMAGVMGFGHKKVFAKIEA